MYYIWFILFIFRIPIELRKTSIPIYIYQSVIDDTSLSYPWYRRKQYNSTITAAVHYNDRNMVFFAVQTVFVFIFFALGL